MSITLHQCPRCARWNQTFACPYCNPISVALQVALLHEHDREREREGLLVAAAAHKCAFAGQPPACPEEWPGEPWLWCGACLAKAVTDAVVPPGDDPQKGVA